MKKSRDHIAYYCICGAEWVGDIWAPADVHIAIAQQWTAEHFDRDGHGPATAQQAKAARRKAETAVLS